MKLERCNIERCSGGINLIDSLRRKVWLSYEASDILLKIFCVESEHRRAILYLLKKRGNLPVPFNDWHGHENFSVDCCCIVLWRALSERKLSPQNNLRGQKGSDSMASWPEEHRKILEDEWSKGTTAAQIGKSLGRTRNSVIGMAHRMKLPGRQPVTKRPESKPYVKRGYPTSRKPAPFLLTRGDPAKKKAVTPIPPPPSVANGAGVDLKGLRYHHCREVIGYRNGVIGDALYCGAPKHKNTSFCEHHYGINFRDPNERRR